MSTFYDIYFAERKRILHELKLLGINGYDKRFPLIGEGNDDDEGYHDKCERQLDSLARALRTAEQQIMYH